MTNEEKIINDWYTGGGFKKAFLTALQAADKEHLRTLVINLQNTLYADIVNAVCRQKGFKIEFQYNDDSSYSWVLTELQEGGEL